VHPLFADFTWGAGGSTAELTLDLTLEAKHTHGLVPNMHLTCTNMQLEKIEGALRTCKERGIRNIVALRGDPPAGEDKWTVSEGGFSCARDLVQYIRQHYGDHFCISVAGYPEVRWLACARLHRPCHL
jgi:methylenetetrahydrofolate reductase (NADPH)